MSYELRGMNYEPGEAIPPTAVILSGVRQSRTELKDLYLLQRTTGDGYSSFRATGREEVCGT
jgi:hypothetical protein